MLLNPLALACASRSMPLTRLENGITTLLEVKRSGIQFPSQLKLCIHRAVFGMLRDVDTKQFKTIFIVSNNSIALGKIYITITYFSG